VKPLKFTLDFRSGIPSYVQIIEQIQGLLAAGELKPGDQLPTVRQLASELRVNFNTIARAYRMLDEAGLISTQRGRGTYILDVAEPEIENHLKKSALHAQIQHFFTMLNRQGYSIEEVEKGLMAVLQTCPKDTLENENEFEEEE
jgi:GntR family transcriptional regulator